jgi:signal transduction histidine kinase
VKFTEKGKIDIKMTNPDKNTIKVEIIDTGPGISKEEQQKLFQKFYRAESTAGKTFGTGLGLYISRLLIEKFGGKIGVISDVGKGSNFWFELPVFKGDVNVTQKV